MLTNPVEINTAMLWLTGSLWGRSWSYLNVVLPWLVVLLPLPFIFCRDLDTLGLGENKASTLGVTVNKPADTVYKIFQRAFGKDMSSGMTAFLLTMIIVIVTCAVLVTFFRTRDGMAIIATGDNEEMVRSSSINADVSRIGGVMISNALVAFSGALLCQYQKYADLNCGNGMLVMGLASVIIGLTFFSNHSVTIQAVGVVLGSLLYRIIIQIAYKIDMPSYAVKLLSAVIVVIALVIPWLQKTYKKKGGRR